MSSPRGPGFWLLAAAGVVVALTVAAALLVMGGPGSQRDVRMDARRVSDLQELETQVALYHQREGRLPADLATLARQPGVALSLADPVSAEPYAYTVLDHHRYRLCARFVTDTARQMLHAIDWAHGVGPTCFDRRVAKSPEEEMTPPERQVAG